MSSRNKASTSVPLDAYRVSSPHHELRPVQVNHTSIHRRPSSPSRIRPKRSLQQLYANETISRSDAAGTDLPPLNRRPAWATRTLNYVPPPFPPPSPGEPSTRTEKALANLSRSRSPSRLRKPPRAHVRVSNASMHSEASDATKVEEAAPPVPIMKKVKSSLSDASSRTRAGTPRSVKFATVPEVCYGYAYDSACACQYDMCECDYDYEYQYQPALFDGDGFRDGVGVGVGAVSHSKEGEQWKESLRRPRGGIIARFIRWLKLGRRWRNEQRRTLLEKVKNPDGLRVDSRPVISRPYPLLSTKAAAVASRPKKPEARSPCIKKIWNTVTCR